MPQSLRRPKDRLSVLLVTSDNMTGELLTNALAHRRNDFTVETLTGSSHRIISDLGGRNAQVALISGDLQDGPEAGMKVLQKLRESHHIPAIMLFQKSTPECVVNAFREGARGVFYRSHSLKSLSKCIRTVHEGQIWAGNEDFEHLITALTHLRPLQFSNAEGKPILTRREEEVVRLVADGMNNREIAESLKVKRNSVRNYIYRIFDKLGVSNRVELMLYAFSQRNRGH